MSRGVRLGILLICLVQAERVFCWWAAQADTQKGFSPQGGGFGGSYPQNPPAEAPAHSGRGSLPYMKASGPSDSGAAASNKVPDRTRTSASAAATRVSSQRRSAAFRPSHFSSFPSERNGNNQRQLIPNFPASGTGGGGAPGPGFAPTEIHNIPQHFGGFAIRRLRAPADQKEVSGRKMMPFAPPTSHVAPQEPALVKQPSYVVPQEPALVKQPSYVVPSSRPRQAAVLRGPPAAVAPLRSRPTWPPSRRPPQQPSYVAPQPPSF
uniref:Uncharacterized protein n=1 Tax=Gasterosteus aculeatus TaxID=69293 RepID=G3NAZ8_GASAC